MWAIIIIHKLTLNNNKYWIDFFWLDKISDSEPKKLLLNISKPRTLGQKMQLQSAAKKALTQGSM